MRKPILLVGLSALAACSGGGPETAGGTSVGGGVSAPSNNASDHTFVNPTVAKTYSAIGGVQSYTYSTDERGNGQYNQLYAGNASTARNSAITVTYDPRDAIFDIKIADTAAGVDQTHRFQDPAHRTDFGGLREPQGGTPNLADQNIRYLQVDNGSTGQLVYDPDQSVTFPIGNANAVRDVSTFFYQKPGTTTQYVTFAGYVRNRTAIFEVTNPDSSKYLRQDHKLERAAFVFGERTPNSSVKTSGTASYSGDMLATMVYNPLIDNGVSDTYYQWITGTQTTSVDFGANSFSSTFNGVVQAPQTDVYTSGIHAMPAGSTFTAAGSGQIDLVNAGGFLGQVGSASFTTPSSIPNPTSGATPPHTVANPTTTATANTVVPVNIAGSSIDGAFYGPNAEEIGGGFRIVGGTPDQRIDILGAFTGKK